MSAERSRVRKCAEGSVNMPKVVGMSAESQARGRARKCTEGHVNTQKVVGMSSETLNMCKRVEGGRDECKKVKRT